MSLPSEFARRMAWFGVDAHSRAFDRLYFARPAQAVSPTALVTSTELKAASAVLCRCLLS
jgi:hypothetical protein